MRTSVLVSLATLTFAVTVSASFQSNPALKRLPQGDHGIAARYPNDKGISRDPAVVFVDGFENSESIRSLRKTWGILIHDGNMRIVKGKNIANGGKNALELSVPKQESSLSIAIAKDLRVERDILFLRWYSKFDREFAVKSGSVHNGGSISAHYFQNGRATAGKKADGKNKFLASLENENTSGKSPGHLNVYCYHGEQRSQWGDHFFPSGRVLPFSSRPHPFGAQFVARKDVIPQRGRWYCYELMVKANTPGKRDGRIACWIDGKLVADFPNRRLRDVKSLKIDRVGLGLYIAKNEVRANKKWYDDVIAATKYIGPIKKHLR